MTRIDRESHLESSDIPMIIQNCLLALIAGAVLAMTANVYRITLALEALAAK